MFLRYPSSSFLGVLSVVFFFTASCHYNQSSIYFQWQQALHEHSNTINTIFDQSIQSFDPCIPCRWRSQFCDDFPTPKILLWAWPLPLALKKIMLAHPNPSDHDDMPWINRYAMNQLLGIPAGTTHWLFNEKYPTLWNINSSELLWTELRPFQWVFTCDPSIDLGFDPSNPSYYWINRHFLIFGGFLNWRYPKMDGL